MLTILRAFVMAAWGHRHQKDKAGKAYLWHVVVVAWVAYGLTREPEAAVVGLLHDYVEDVDCVLGPSRIRMRFGERVAKRVGLLTREVGLEYLMYVEQIVAAEDGVVLAVKLADLLHNTMPGRLHQARHWSAKRLEYNEALHRLIDVRTRLT